MIVSRSLSNNIITEHTKLYKQKTKCANAKFVEADSVKVNFAEYRCDKPTFAKYQYAKSVAVAQQTLCQPQEEGPRYCVATMYIYTYKYIYIYII